MRKIFISTLICLGLAAPAMSRPAVDAVYGLPPAKKSEDRRCSDDGLHCIYRDNYVADVCRVIERAASRNHLDKNFLARLLWKESLFEPGAISHAGAEGIAQFIPSTAAIVKLDDPFNPALAISVAARYLAELSDRFGNIGLAAVAYNGGENRAARFLASGGTLPYETQDYVEAITGHNAWKWRDEPPPPSQLDLRLDQKKAFVPACTELAGNRTLREFPTGAVNVTLPWGVILASHPQRAAAQRQITRLNRQLRPLLKGNPVGAVHRRLNGNPRKVYTAQVGYKSKSEAAALCLRLRQSGISCIVLRN